MVKFGSIDGSISIMLVNRKQSMIYKHSRRNRLSLLKLDLKRSAVDTALLFIQRNDWSGLQINYNIKYLALTKSCEISFQEILRNIKIKQNLLSMF